VREAASLTIVVPTYNERGNIRPLLEALDRNLSVGDWKVIFVDDDSPDKTAGEVQMCQSTYSNVELISRVGRRGLSSACIEGFTVATTPFVAVIDADLQHDESILIEMLRLLRDGKAEMVVGTRFKGFGSTGAGLPPLRKFISQSAALLTRVFFRVEMSDPMSGFFMMKREVFEQVSNKLSAVGFKIMMDLVINHRGKLSVMEVPYTMRARHAGESKLDWAVAFEYVAMLISLRLNKLVSPAFVTFSAVGSVGLFVHAVVLYFVSFYQQTTFLASQGVATFVAMTTNFFLNNEITFRRKKLHGHAMLPGLLSFYVVCSLGAVINLAISQLLYSAGAFYMVAGISGALLAAVWNYLTTSKSVWR
jgi:dolichol-phosphate mannosyltransferase